MFPIGVIVINWAVKHNMAMSSKLSFAVRWHGRLSRSWYYGYTNAIQCHVYNSSSDGGQSCRKAQ